MDVIKNCKDILKKQCIIKENKVEIAKKIIDKHISWQNQ